MTIDEASKILVTGGNGGLGRALSTLGCDAVGRDILDITSESSIEAAIDTRRPKLIINCAGYTAVDKAENDVEAAHAVNAHGARNLAKACNAQSTPLIQISTDCVFGDGNPEQHVLETDAPNPLSIYGASKLAGEKAVLAAGQPRVCVVRVSWLFGAKAESFISKIMAAAQTRDTLQMVDDEYGRPTPLSGLATQLMLLAERMLNDMPVPEILHLGPREAASRLGWAQAVFDHSAKQGGPAPKLMPCSAATFHTAARRPRGLILNVAAATDLLGPMPSWRDATNAAVARLLLEP